MVVELSRVEVWRWGSILVFGDRGAIPGVARTGGCLEKVGRKPAYAAFDAGLLSYKTS